MTRKASHKRRFSVFPLTKFNDQTIQYDNVGNPTSYDGWTYTWEDGRQLKRRTKAGSTIDYKYDADDI